VEKRVGAVRNVYGAEEWDQRVALLKGEMDSRWSHCLPFILFTVGQRRPSNAFSLLSRDLLFNSYRIPVIYFLAEYRDRLANPLFRVMLDDVTLKILKSKS